MPPQPRREQNQLPTQVMQTALPPAPPVPQQSPLAGDAVEATAGGDRAIHRGSRCVLPQRPPPPPPPPPPPW